MKQNVFLFTGEETYLLYDSLKKRKISFEEKYGKGNIFQYRWDDVEPWNIMNSIFWGGLFVSRKLIIIYWLPKDGSEENKFSDVKYKDLEEKIIYNFERIPTDIVLVIVSFSPDKRTKWFKFFSTNCVVKQFDKLDGKWIKEFGRNCFNWLIDDKILDYFLGKIWTDFFSIKNESIKLMLYAEKNNLKIDKQMIDYIIFSQIETNSFDVLDKMFFEKEKTLNLINELQVKWSDQFQFLGMLYWWLKIVLQLIDFYNKWEKSSKELASKMKVHPFVIIKNLKIIDRLVSKEQEIKIFFQNLIMLDSWIKSWIIPSELFWLEIKKIILMR